MKNYSIIIFGVMILLIKYSPMTEFDQSYPMILSDTISNLNFETNQEIQPQSSTSDYYFNSSEQIKRNYAINSTISSAFTLETPSEYDSGQFNISVGVKSSTYNETIIESSEVEALSRYEQAQSFNLTSECNLDKISLYFGPNNKQNSSTQIQIRNNTYNGEILYNSLIYSNYKWTNYTLDNPLQLQAGKYFVRLAAIPEQNYRYWCASSSGDNQTETWINNGGWILANYDLTLKIYTSAILTPESVNLTINGYPVNNTEQNKGNVIIHTNLSSSSELTFYISSNISIKLEYSGEAIFNRIFTHPLTLSIENQMIKGIINLSLAEYLVPYENYIVNITGFLADYEDITPIKGENVIGFTKITTNTIKMSVSAEYITFKSPNYVESLIVTPIGYSGETTEITFSLKESGNVRLEFWYNNTIFNWTEYFSNNNSSSFQWFIDPNLSSGIYEIKLYYNTSTHLGYLNHTCAIMKESELSISPLNVDALDNIQLNTDFHDKHLESIINNAHIEYRLNDIQGNFQEDDQGHYTGTIDLNIFALKPGSYEIEVQAEKSGYRSASVKTPLTINFRNLTIGLSQSKVSLHPGDNISMQISTLDSKTNQSLLRPVDIRLSLKGKNENGTEFEMLSTWIYGTIRTNELTLAIPSDVHDGSYDIAMDVYSDYYIGNVRLENAINIEYPENSNIYLISGLSIIGAMLGIGFFIQFMKNKAKKSLGGILIVHEQGTPMADLVSEEYAMGDPILIAGAVMGMVTLIKEITGKGLHILQIEGEYVNLLKIENYWVVLFMRNNPWWVQREIIKMTNDIHQQYGEKMRDFNGENPRIVLNPLIENHFGKNNELIKSLQKIHESKEKYWMASDITNKFVVKSEIQQNFMAEADIRQPIMKQDNIGDQNLELDVENDILPKK